MRISDWSSDVCSSDLAGDVAAAFVEQRGGGVEVVVGQGQGEVGQRLGHARGGRHAEGQRAAAGLDQIGRASCRERVCQYVSISVVAVLLKKNKNNIHNK